MAFGLSYPFGFSLFDGIDLFTEPRYVRRNYIHPEPLWTRHRRPHRFGVQNRKPSRYSPSLFDLLSFGDELFNTLADEDTICRLSLDPEPKTIESKELNDSTTDKTAAIAGPSAADSDNSANVVSKAQSAIAERKKSFGEVLYEKTEDGSKYQVHLPGLSVEDVKLDLDTKQRALMVKAEKKTEEKHEDEHGTRTSIRHVSVSRMLPLETLPEAGDIAADFIDGVLHISVKHKAIEASETVKPLRIGSPASSPVPSSAVETPAETPAVPEKESEATESTTEPIAVESSAPTSTDDSSMDITQPSNATSDSSSASEATVEDAADE